MKLFLGLRFMYVGLVSAGSAKKSLNCILQLRGQIAESIEIFLCGWFGVLAEKIEMGL